MSSMRNTVQRRNHRERGQPLEREKWGLLEKHKDYSLRARDYGEKRARLKVLRQKAAERNPDEFHYGMLSSRTDRGKKLADRGNPSLGQDVIKLLKTQDLGYLQCMLQKTRRAIQVLEHEFVLVEGAGVKILSESRKVERGHHIVLVQNAQAQRQYNPRLALECDVKEMEQQRYSLYGNDREDEIKDREHNIVDQKIPRQAEEEDLSARNRKIPRKTSKQVPKVERRKLSALRIREKDLRDAVDEVERQRANMSNSAGGLTKDGLKWKTRERKR